MSLISELRTLIDSCDVPTAVRAMAHLQADPLYLDTRVLFYKAKKPREGTHPKETKPVKSRRRSTGRRLSDRPDKIPPDFKEPVLPLGFRYVPSKKPYIAINEQGDALTLETDSLTMIPASFRQDGRIKYKEFGGARRYKSINECLRETFPKL